MFAFLHLFLSSNFCRRLIPKPIIDRRNRRFRQINHFDFLPKQLLASTSGIYLATAEI
jgi:hypothetical protein